MATEIRLGWMLELIPRDPPPALEGLTLVGEIVSVDLPVFALACPGLPGKQRFRLHENGELAVRVFGVDSVTALYKVGRTYEAGFL